MNLRTDINQIIENILDDECKKQDDKRLRKIINEALILELNRNLSQSHTKTIPSEYDAIFSKGLKKGSK